MLKHLSFDFLHPQLKYALTQFLQNKYMIQPLIELLIPQGEGIFSFPVFSEEFCDILIDEIDNANSISLNFTRPNSMNNYGVIANEIGLKNFIDELVEQVISPLAKILFSDWGGSSLTHQHSFFIRYKKGEDLELSRHMDQSEITLNVCLGKVFDGGDVFFDSQRDHPREPILNRTIVKNRKGFGIFHVGQHWHGATKLIEGERHNFVIWARSDKFHQSPAEQFYDCENRNSSPKNKKIDL
eukprot:c31291_g1_i1.p1 GENE.c31291_g1_i1~~c31291_g1_i1.p1  ORF type:complete len:267 (+),score=91.48 c31291_g1_i1:79-801(+)